MITLQKNGAQIVDDPKASHNRRPFDCTLPGAKKP
jgi:hypothetical protein